MSIFIKPEAKKGSPSLIKRFGTSFGSHQKLWSRSETKLWTINFFFGTCVLYASRVSLPICAVAMAKEYGWTITDSGTILSCFFWGYAATQVVAGSIADFHSGERVLPFTTLVWSALTLFTPQLFDFAYWTNSPLLILVTIRVLTGVGQGFHLPSMASIVSRHLTASDKGRVFGICLAGSHFGSIVAGGVGSLLIDLFGWRSLFHFVGIISFIWYLFFERLTDSVLSGRRTRIVFDSGGDPMKDESLTESDHFIKKKPNKGMVMATTVPWSKLFRHPSFWAASLAQYCGANAYFTMFSWLPYYFSDNFPQATAFVYNVVPSLAIVFTSLFAPYFASKLLTHGFSVTFARRFMESVSLIGMGICLLLVSLSSQFTISLTLFTLAMALRGLHHAGVSVNPHDFAPDHTGSVFGIFNAFSAITGFIGVYLAGWILHSSNNQWAYVFVFTAFQCIIGAIVYGLKGTGSRII
ncbi:hypothetical protein ACQ4LE_010076 [Meloidogyne hapla]